MKLACPKPEIINESKLPWNDFDRKEMVYCEKKCPYEYRGSECLKKFIKLGFQDYYCECGYIKQ